MQQYVFEFTPRFSCCKFLQSGKAIFQVQSDLGTFDAYLNVRNFTCYKLDKAYYKKMHIYKAYLCNNKS